MSPHGIMTAALAPRRDFAPRHRSLASASQPQGPGNTRKPTCTLIRTLVRLLQQTTWRIRPPWRIRYPREYQILRITRILQDLLVVGCSTDRLSNTRRTGLSGGRGPGWRAARGRGGPHGDGAEGGSRLRAVGGDQVVGQLRPGLPGPVAEVAVGQGDAGQPGVGVHPQEAARTPEVAEGPGRVPRPGPVR